MESTGIVPTMPIGGDGFGGGSGIWLFALLILFGMGGNGFGWGNRGNGYPTDYATQQDVVTTSAFNQLQDENLQIMNNSQRIGTELQQALYNASYNNLSEVKTLEGNVATGFANMQNCCCSIQRNIDSVNYNGALNTAAIKEAVILDGQKTRDLIASNKIESLQSEVNQLRLAQATQNVVRYPNAFTYPAGNPFFGNGFGGPQNI